MITIEEVGKVCESFGMGRVADGLWTLGYEVRVWPGGVGNTLPHVDVEVYDGDGWEERARVMCGSPESEALLSAVLSVLLKEGDSDGNIGSSRDTTSS